MPRVDDGFEEFETREDMEAIKRTSEVRRTPSRMARVKRKMRAMNEAMGEEMSAEDTSGLKEGFRRL